MLRSPVAGDWRRQPRHRLPRRAEQCCPPCRAWRGSARDSLGLLSARWHSDALPVAPAAGAGWHALLGFRWLKPPRRRGSHRPHLRDDAPSPLSTPCSSRSHLPLRRALPCLLRLDPQEAPPGSGASGEVEIASALHSANKPAQKRPPTGDSAPPKAAGSSGPPRSAGVAATAEPAAASSTGSTKGKVKGKPRKYTPNPEDVVHPTTSCSRHAHRDKAGSCLAAYEFNLTDEASALGEGASGKVVVGKDRKTGKEVAIKVMVKRKLQDEDIAAVSVEVDAMQRVRSASCLGPLAWSLLLTATDPLMAGRAASTGRLLAQVAYATWYAPARTTPVFMPDASYTSVALSPVPFALAPRRPRATPTLLSSLHSSTSRTPSTWPSSL